MCIHTVEGPRFAQVINDFVEQIGLEWISAAEGPRFAQVINDFVEQIRKLGPSPVGKGVAS